MTTDLQQELATSVAFEMTQEIMTKQNAFMERLNHIRDLVNFMTGNPFKKVSPFSLEGVSYTSLVITIGAMGPDNLEDRMSLQVLDSYLTNVSNEIDGCVYLHQEKPELFQEEVVKKALAEIRRYEVISVKEAIKFLTIHTTVPMFLFIQEMAIEALYRKTVSNFSMIPESPFNPRLSHQENMVNFVQHIRDFLTAIIAEIHTFISDYNNDTLRQQHEEAFY